MTWVTEAKYELSKRESGAKGKVDESKAGVQDTQCNYGVLLLVGHVEVLLTEDAVRCEDGTSVDVASANVHRMLGLSVRLVTGAVGVVRSLTRGDTRFSALLVRWLDLDVPEDVRDTRLAFASCGGLRRRERVANQLLKDLNLKS